MFRKNTTIKTHTGYTTTIVLLDAAIGLRKLKINEIINIYLTAVKFLIVKDVYVLHALAHQILHE